jgi:ABC-type multidrug transport system fused ATPase/permease subunit
LAYQDLISCDSIQDVIDENLPESLHFTWIFGLILITAGSHFFIFIAFFSLLAFSFYTLPSIVLRTFTMNANGALIGLVNEALEGLDVIQAHKKQLYLIYEIEKRLNLYHRFFSNSEGLNLWLASYCDLFGAIFVLGVSMFAVIMKDEYKPEHMDRVLSNVIQVLVFYNWFIRFLADTISHWGSIERISGLATTTPQETELEPALQSGESAIASFPLPSNFFPSLYHFLDIGLICYGIFHFIRVLFKGTFIKFAFCFGFGIWGFLIQLLSR